MLDAYILRRTSADKRDVDIVANHRVRMFAEMGLLVAGDIEALREQSVRWFEPLLSQGEYLGWFTECEGEVVAGAGIYLRSFAPSPECLYGGRWAHIANVYTQPPHRGRGLARQLLWEILDWCRTEGIARVTLTASEAGRALYEQLGFEATGDMQWRGNFHEP